MKNKWTVFLAGALLAVLSGTAAARDQVSLSFSFGAPAVAYVAPPPVYYYPPPVVYYAPPPVYYAPAPWAIRVDAGHHWGWNRHHWRHR